MQQFYPDEGLPIWLARLILADLRFHLFENNFTPDRDTELADLTEASWAGYTSIDVSSGDWTLLAIAAHVQKAVASPIVFLNTSGGNVQAYGYYVTDTGEAELLAAARFDLAPITLVATTGTLPVTPFLGDFSGPT